MNVGFTPGEKGWVATPRTRFFSNFLPCGRFRGKRMKTAAGFIQS
jgi:hypothetical protein